MIKSKILMAIPVYNCEKQIKRVLEKIKKFDNINLISELLIIDNISKDKTLEVSKNNLDIIQINSKIFQNSKNINLGGSHKVIFDYALESGFDYVIIIHGDDQANINDLNDIMVNLEFKKYDWLRGSRFEKHSKLHGYSKIKTFGNIFFNIIFSILTLKKISDIGSGLDIYSTKLIEKINYYNFPNRLTFDYFMILYTGYKKTNIKFFPINWYEFDQVSNVRLFSQTIELFKILLYYIFFKKKMFEEKNSNLKYNYNQVFQSKNKI